MSLRRGLSAYLRPKPEGQDRWEGDVLLRHAQKRGKKQRISPFGVIWELTRQFDCILEHPQLAV